MITREVVVNLIKNTATSTGLEVLAVLDENDYLTGIEEQDSEIAGLNIQGEVFHPEWNYTIFPKIS